MTSINYPVSVVSDSEKYAYLYRLQQLLLLAHNEKGRQFRDEEITEAQWISYQSDEFDPKSAKISEEICKYRELLKSDDTSAAQLTDIVDE